MPPKMFLGQFLLLLLWGVNWRGLPVCSHRSETKTAKLSKSQMQMTILIVAPWQSSLDLRGPSIRLQTGFRPHLSSGTLLVRPRSADSVNFDPHHRFLSSERSADCCSNTCTAQVLRQVVRRKSESVDSRSPGRGASRPGELVSEVGPKD